MTDEELLAKAEEFERLSLRLDEARRAVLQIDAAALAALRELAKLRGNKGDEFGDEYTESRDAYGAEISALIDELDEWAEFYRVSGGGK